MSSGRPPGHPLPLGLCCLVSLNGHLSLPSLVQSVHSAQLSTAGERRGLRHIKCREYFLVEKKNIYFLVETFLRLNGACSMRWNLVFLVEQDSFGWIRQPLGFTSCDNRHPVNYESCPKGWFCWSLSGMAHVCAGACGTHVA